MSSRDLRLNDACITERYEGRAFTENGSRDTNATRMKTKVQGFVQLAILFGFFCFSTPIFGFFDPTIGRWINRDPQGETGGANLYAFTLNSPIDSVDRDGQDTYICNRQLGASPLDSDTARSRHNIFTHTFLFIRDQNGVIHTFSWGNAGSSMDWAEEDRPEDVNAARQAYSDGKAQHIENSSFDQYVVRAYQHLKTSEQSHHINLVLWANCKTEAANLRDQAMIYWLSGDDPPP